MSNYERKLMKKFGDILEPQMVFMPKDRQFSEDKSVEYRADQIVEIDKKEPFFDDRLLPPRKVPRPHLKRGSSQEQNNLDPEFGLGSYEDSEARKITKSRG